MVLPPTSKFRFHFTLVLLIFTIEIRLNQLIKGKAIHSLAVALFALVYFLQQHHACGQHAFNHLDEGNGLPSNMVDCIMEDRDGFIWLGTNTGLCRFDGSETIVFQHDPTNPATICDDQVRSLYQDRGGWIWIGTARGVSAYNPIENRFTNFFHDAADPRSLSFESIQVITGDPAGNVIITNDGRGMDLLDSTSGSFIHVMPSDQVSFLPARYINTCICAVSDPGDNRIIWFGTLQGILRYDSETGGFEHFQLEKSQAVNPSKFSEMVHTVRDILVDSDGQLWLATWGGGLCHFNPGDGTFEIFNYEPLQPLNPTRNNLVRLLEKNDNEFWVLTRSKGVAVFNKTTRQFTFFPITDRGVEPGIIPTDIIITKNGFLLISTTSGLYFSHPDAWQFNKTIIPHPLKGIAACPSEPGVIYTGMTGTYGRYVVFNIETGRYSSYGYKPENDRSENFFQDFFCGKERNWLVENFNLYWWDRDKNRIELYGDFNPSAASVSDTARLPFLISGCESDSGEIWIGSKFHGIYRIIPQTGEVKNYHFPDESAGNSYLNNFVHVLFPDSKGRIWYSSTDFGYFDTGTQKFTAFTMGRDFPASPVPSIKVISMTETPDGLIWLGTVNSGIHVIDPAVTPVYAGFYMSHTGLSGSTVRDLLTDNMGMVWAITEKGLSRIDPGSGRIDHFGPEYGLAGLDEMANLSSGEIAITANEGIYRFEPGQAKALNHTIIPYIKSFRVFDSIAGYFPQLDKAGNISLKHDQNFFSIEYSVINYFNPAQTVFSYMLDGMDDTWITAGKRKYVSYTNLPGGDYVFRLRASDGKERFAETSLALHVGTPYWETPWFYTLMVVLASTLVYMAFRNRVQQLRKQQEIRSSYDRMVNQLEMKALRAQMNPHFLFNSLNSIRYYILKEDADHAAEYLTKFSKLLRLILRNSRQNMISLAEELETLNIYVNFEQMRFGKSFDYRLDIDKGVNTAEIMIQPMTLQPFVENAIWHGLMPKEDDQRRLRVSIKADGNILRIIVEDNGIGRAAARLLRQPDEGAENKSYGLQITRERFSILQRIRGKKSDFEVEDLFDLDQNPCGTRVTIDYEL